VTLSPRFAGAWARWISVLSKPHWFWFLLKSGMRTIITAFVFVASLFIADAKEDKFTRAMKSADSIVWMGLDYSLMRMIGTTNTIKVPDLLLQDMPARWNELFLDERIEGVATSLGRRIDIDIAGVTERNKRLNAAQVLLDKQTKGAAKDTHITPKDIEGAVQTIKTTRKDGIGLMFIVDRMVSESWSLPVTGKAIEGKTLTRTAYAAAVYVVFFDVATREVLSAKREVRTIGTGGSFRNFWFGPIKDVDSELSQYR
jgi:hypothetical protein